MTTCEDFPCCGHERGDCDGSLYGTDAAIREAEYRRSLTDDFPDDLPDDDAECTPHHACQDCEGEPTGWECTWCGRPCPPDAHTY